MNRVRLVIPRAKDLYRTEPTLIETIWEAFQKDDPRLKEWDDIREASGRELLREPRYFDHAAAYGRLVGHMLAEQWNVPFLDTPQVAIGLYLAGAAARLLGGVDGYSLRADGMERFGYGAPLSFDSFKMKDVLLEVTRVVTVNDGATAS